MAPALQIHYLSQKYDNGGKLFTKCSNIHIPVFGWSFILYWAFFFFFVRHFFIFNYFPSC